MHELVVVGAVEAEEEATAGVAVVAMEVVQDNIEVEVLY